MLIKINMKTNETHVFTTTYSAWVYFHVYTNKHKLYMGNTESLFNWLNCHTVTFKMPVDRWKAWSSALDPS